MALPEILHHGDDGAVETVLLPIEGRVDVVFDDDTCIAMGTTLGADPMSLQEQVKKAAADRLARHAALIVSQPVLRGMYESYQRALSFAEHELVHLFEIAEAAAEYFGGEHAARRALPTTGTARRLLGRLANHDQLSESRHRGRLVGGTRPMTALERKEVRQAAKELILAFERYLEAHAVDCEPASPHANNV